MPTRVKLTGGAIYILRFVGLPCQSYYGVHTISPAISVVVGPTDGSLPIPLQHVRAHE